MPQHGHDDQPLADVFDPSTVEVREGADDAEREATIKAAHREFEANKLSPGDRAMHDARRALVARGFTTQDDETFTHPNGENVILT